MNTEAVSILVHKVQSCSSEKVREFIYVYIKPQDFCFPQNENLTLPTVGVNSKRNRKQKSPLELG